MALRNLSAISAAVDISLNRRGALAGARWLGLSVALRTNPVNTKMEKKLMALLKKGGGALNPGTVIAGIEDGTPKGSFRARHGIGFKAWITQLPYATVNLTGSDWSISPAGVAPEPGATASGTPAAAAGAKVAKAPKAKAPKVAKLKPKTKPKATGSGPGLAGCSPNQQSYIDVLNSAMPFVVVTGPAGTGKTAIACHAAVVALKANRVKKLVITRPLVTADEEIGFLPGGVEAKLAPYLQPINDALRCTSQGGVTVRLGFRIITG